jgi:hypothetical protein
VVQFTTIWIGRVPEPEHVTRNKEALDEQTIVVPETGTLDVVASGPVPSHLPRTTPGAGISDGGPA